MSRLNLESLNAVLVNKAIETLTFFYTPGESKQNKKKEVVYSKKKVTNSDKKKVEAPEEYLQVKRFESANSQTLSFYLQDEKVADFIFTVDGVKFETTPKWDQAKMYICIPTDATFDTIVAEDLSFVFKQWLFSKRFEDYLERQAESSRFTTAFVKLVLLFMAWSENRDKEEEDGNITIIKDGVDSSAVARSYTKLLTKLHNTSDRTKKLFPIRPLLAPSQPTTTKDPTVEVVTDSTKNEPEEVTLEPITPIVEVVAEPEKAAEVTTEAIEVTASLEDEPATEEESKRSENNRKKFK